MAKKSSQKSLTDWGRQDWGTKSGKPSSQTGERYLPRKAIAALSGAEYGATTRAKREGTRRGQQNVAQPAKIAAKTRRYR